MNCKTNDTYNFQRQTTLQDDARKRSKMLNAYELEQKMLEKYFFKENRRTEFDAMPTETSFNIYIFNAKDCKREYPFFVSILIKNRTQRINKQCHMLCDMNDGKLILRYRTNGNLSFDSYINSNAFFLPVKLRYPDDNLFDRGDVKIEHDSFLIFPFLFFCSRDIIKPLTIVFQYEPYKSSVRMITNVPRQASLRINQEIITSEDLMGSNCTRISLNQACDTTISFFFSRETIFKVGFFYGHPKPYILISPSICEYTQGT